MKKVLILLGVLLTVSFLVEVIFLTKDASGHHHPWWHTVKAAQGIIGLISGVLLMFFAKSLGKFFLYRKSDYYEASQAMSFPRRRESTGSPTKPIGDDNANEEKP